jgi:hypothetical protein
MKILIWMVVIVLLLCSCKKVADPAVSRWRARPAFGVVVPDTTAPESLYAPTLR